MEEKKIELILTVNGEKQVLQDLDNIELALQQTEQGANTLVENLGKVGDKSNRFEEGVRKWGKSVVDGLSKNISAKGIELVGRAFDELKDSMYEVSDASVQLAVKTGLSESALKKYQGIMQEVKSNNYGKDYTDIASALGEVVQTMGDMNPSAMSAATESAIALRDILGLEVNETVKAADVLMQTMGVDAEKAFALIAAGAQNGLNSSGELLNTIVDNSKVWSDAGFSAEEMFAFMEKGLSTNTHNLKTMNEYFDEFEKSLGNGLVEQHLGSFSEETRALFEQWKSGELDENIFPATAYKAIVTDLSNMKDQQEALTIATEIWASMGQDSALQIVGALSDVNTSYYGAKQSMESLKAVHYGDLEAAVSGLGNAIDANIVTPIATAALPAVTGLLQGATNVINGIGAALSPQKTELDLFVDEIKTSNDEIQTMIENASQMQSSGEMDAAKLEAYKTSIMSINKEEGASSLKKYELKNAVTALAGEIPELAAAWDEETERINLSESAIEALIDQQIAYAKESAATMALQETYNAKIAAEANKLKIDSSVADLTERKKVLEEKNRETDDFVKGGYGDYYAELLEVEVALEELIKEQTEATETANAASEQYENLATFVNEATEEEAEAAAKVAEHSDELNGLSEAADNAAASTENFGTVATGTSDQIAAAAQAAAQAQEQASKTIMDTYHGYVSELQAGFQDKVSLFDFFDTSDGGEDMTVEQMTANLDSQIEAFENYQKNLEEVRSHVGDTIAPEFMAYLESMGMEGANTLEHIIATFEEGETGVDKVKEMSDKWCEAWDMTEPMAEQAAANKLAYEMAMGEFGSSEEDFEELREAVDEAVNSVSEGWEGLSENTYDALQEAIQTAQDCGIQIPEGLADGIASGEIAPEDAISQLNGAVQGNLDGLIGVAQELGIQIPDDIAAGIAAGGQAAIDAYAYLISEISDQSIEAQAAGEEGGEAAATGYQSSLTSGKEKATAAGSELMTAVRTTMASAGGFYEIGSNIASSVALGILLGTGKVIAASVGMATAALVAAKIALGIASPSKPFRKDVGQNISESTAFGINDKASLAGRAAARMSNKVYSRAVSWLAKYKKKQQVSLKDEKYYWEEVVKHTKKGTNAYNKAMEKVKKYTSLTNLTSKGITADAAEEILDNFGVSKTTGKGKSKKKKDTETYYSDIYSAAEKYLSNRKIIEDWSLEQELAYWTAIEKRLKDGTQAWYDAKEKISDLQNDIAEAEAKAAEQKLKTHVNVQDDILDAYKVYYNLSAKAEAEYWDIARQQFTEETEERIQADENYMKALEDWYDERKKLDEDYAENSKDINDQLIEDIQNLQEAYTDAVKSRKEDILSSMNLFDSWDTEGYDGETLIYNLKTQVAGLELWEQQLEELSKKGLSEDLMESLTEMGPDAAANIYSLNQMTPEQLAEYNQLWLQKSALAEAQAIKENESLRLETNEEIAQLRLDAQAELDALYADYKASLQELETGLSRGLKDLIDQAGSLEEENVASLVTGLGKAAKSVEAYNSTLKQLNQAASQLSDMGAVTVPDYSGVMKLNQMTELYASPTSVINVDNTGMIQAVQQMMTGMESMLERMENLQVVMDTGAMVGALQPAISQESAAVTVRKNRGRL